MFSRLTAEVDGAQVETGEKSWEDDEPGNQYDTEITVGQILTYNEIYDRLCTD